MNQTIFNLHLQQGRYSKYHFLCSLLFIVTLFSSLTCSASLLVTPSRVVFEDRTRTEQVTLNNKGNETATYRISFIRQNMTEDGKFIPIGDNEEGLYSDEIVRYSPRQITLEPGQSQVIRLMLRKPKGLADGEYRSHMLMQALPKTTKSDISKAVENGSNEISVEITTIVGVSIPVIVRHGKLDTELKLANARYIKSVDANNKSYIELDMNRAGNKSVYGDFRVNYVPENGAPVVVGYVKGVAVYSPNTLRRFQIPINTPGGLVFKKGYFHITYTESGKDEQSGLIDAVDLNL